MSLTGPNGRVLGQEIPGCVERMNFESQKSKGACESRPNLEDPLAFSLIRYLTKVGVANEKQVDHCGMGSE